MDPNQENINSASMNQFFSDFLGGPTPAQKTFTFKSITDLAIYQQKHKEKKLTRTKLMQLGLLISRQPILIVDFGPILISTVILS